MSDDLARRAAAAGEGAERSPRLRWAGRLIAPLLALLVYLLLPQGPGGLTSAGRATAAIGVLVAVLWMTEAMPLAATALLPVALFPLAGVLPIEEAVVPYANKIIFLFMGGFMLALAMERWNLHRRLALLTLMVVGTRSRRMVGGFMVTTGVISMWVSNTAATVMMLPIGLSVLALPDRPQGDADRASPTLAVCLMLGIAYAASIGGIATLERELQVLMERGPERVSPFLVPMFIADLLAGQLSIMCGARGPNFGIVSACATSGQSVREGSTAVHRSSSMCCASASSLRSRLPDSRSPSATVPRPRAASMNAARCASSSRCCVATAINTSARS